MRSAITTYSIYFLCHFCNDTLSFCFFTDTDAGEKLTFNSATNTMGPRKFLHYGTFRKVCNLSNLDKIFFEIVSEIFVTLNFFGNILFVLDKKWQGACRISFQWFSAFNTGILIRIGIFIWKTPWYEAKAV